MWWIIIIFIILCIFIYLIFAPFFIEIDSNTGLFRIRFHVLASARLIFNNDSIFLKLKIGWWKKEYDLLERKEKKKYQTELPVTIKVKTKKPFSIIKGWKKIKGIVNSFRINKCHIMIDTGSMPWNGILYPWFYLLSRQMKKNMMINFWGENTIILQIENSIARMLWAYVKS